MGAELTIPAALPATLAADFYGAELVVLPNHLDTDWIWIKSIHDALQFAQAHNWDGILRRLEYVDVAVLHNGERRLLRFVNRRDFWNLAINHSRFEEFKQRVLDLVESKHEGRLVEIDPALIDNLQVRTVMALLQATHDSQLALHRVAMAEAKVDKLSNRVDGHEQRICDAEQQATTAIDAVTGLKGWFRLVPWAISHGIHLRGGKTCNDGEQSREGKRATELSRKLGVEPKKRPDCNYPHGVNIYPERVLLEWLEDYRSRHPKR